MLVELNVILGDHQSHQDVMSKKTLMGVPKFVPIHPVDLSCLTLIILYIIFDPVISPKNKYVSLSVALNEKSGDH